MAVQKARTDKVVLVYDREAGRLEISLLHQEAGEKKVIALDYEDFSLHPQARALLAGAMEEWNRWALWDGMRDLWERG